MKCLVIGFGSIGKRHVRILSEMGHEVAILSQMSSPCYPSYTDLTSAITSFNPEYVVISNDTNMHVRMLDALAKLDYQGITLVEKPLAACLSELGRIPKGPIFVGYTLRFHPALRQVVSYLRNESLWTLTAYCGQFLPDWRPDRDYRGSYSSRAYDGGVIRDLSHELDYAQLIAGSWLETVAIGGKTSTLEIYSEDAATILAKCDRCSVVTIHLNYLDRNPSRWIVANGSFGTLKADLISGTVNLNGEDKHFTIERDDTIRRQHICAMARNEDKTLCTFEDAKITTEWIDALHFSIANSCWKKRSKTKILTQGF